MSRRQFVRAAGAGGVLLVAPSLADSARAAWRRPTAGADGVVLRWNEAALEGVRQSALGPPMVSRALAIVHTSIFDAWAAYDAKAVGTRLGGSLRRPARERTLANKETAISFGAYRAAVDLFPGSKATVFDPLMASLGYDPNDHSMDTTSPTGIGNVAAKALLDFRHADGSNQLDNAPGGAPGVPYSDYTGYVPANLPMDMRFPLVLSTVNDPNRWQPLRWINLNGDLVTPSFIGPHGQNVTPFALTSGAQFRGGPPVEYGSNEYAQQAADLLELSAALTDREKMIAEYWADGPRSELPPGHWDLFAQFVSRRDPPPPRRARHRRRREAVLRAHERDHGRGHLLLGHEATLGLRATGHGDPLPLLRPTHPRMGRPVPGNEDNPGRGMAPVPAEVVRDATVRRVHLGP